MLQIVLDTNVLISAVLSSRGASAALLARVGGGDFEINLSATLVLEYEEVLKRYAPKAGITPGEVDELVAYLCTAGSCRRGIGRARPMLRDPDDEFVAELAIAIRCDYLVTHNVRDFQPLVAQGIPVVRPGRFLAVVEGTP